jgi:hypothetical protein
MNDKQTRSEQEQMLDEALAETFPASDPVAMQQRVIVRRVERPFAEGVSSVKTKHKD